MQLEIKWDLAIIHTKIGEEYIKMSKVVLWVVGNMDHLYCILFGCNVLATQIHLY